MGGGGPNGARPVHGASGSPWGLPRRRGSSPQGSLGQRGRGQSREAQRGVQESWGRLRTCWVTEPTEEAPGGGAKGCLAPRTWPLGGGSPPLGGWRQVPLRGPRGVGRGPECWPFLEFCLELHPASVSPFNAEVCSALRDTAPSVLHCCLVAGPGWAAASAPTPPSPTAVPAGSAGSAGPGARRPGCPEATGLTPKHELVLPPAWHHGFR